MTEIEVNVIVNILDCFGAEQHTKEQMIDEKGNIDMDTIFDSRLDMSDIQIRDKQMKELNVNWYEATNYLIQLFGRTEEKYSCSGTKIGKLLTILAFVYARKGEKLFDAVILKYDNCGATIKGLKSYVDVALYLPIGCKDTKRYIENIRDDLREDVKIPQKYQDTSSLSKDVKDNIEKVFRKFGAYSARDLGQAINPIVDCEKLICENDEIDIQGIYSLQYEDLKVENYLTDLIDYLFK